LREAEFGNAIQAKQQAKAALALARGRDVRVLAALALVGMQSRPKGGYGVEPRVSTGHHDAGLCAADRTSHAGPQPGEGQLAVGLLKPTSDYELGTPQAFSNTVPPLYADRPI
jgi:hypothetical protein